MDGNPAFCDIDVGTGGIKCLVFDERGRLLFREVAAIDFRFDGHAIDFDPLIVWQDICRMMRSAVRHCAKLGMRIAAVSSTSMREGNVFYDKKGKELLAVPNLDARAYKEAEKIQDSQAEAIYDSSGHWPSSIFLACRLLFLERNQPEIFSKIEKISMINDWVLYKFSGELATEPTNGCETALFSLKRRTWDDELIKEHGFERSIFPDVRECGTVLGKIAPEVCEETGLESSTEIIVGAADTEAAVAGCGLFNAGSVAAVAGTTTPVQAVVELPRLDPERRTWSCCHVLPNRWTVESNAGGTGLVFNWWARMTGMQFSDLDREVEEDNPGEGKVKVNVGTSIMNAKNTHPLVGSIVGVSTWSKRSEITLGILESNCFSVRANLEQLESVLGKKFEEIYFCGGASGSRLWRELQANVIGRTLISFGIGEATGRGAAMLSATSIGVFPDVIRASQSFLKGSEFAIKPDEVKSRKYESIYRRWLSTSI